MEAAVERFAAIAFLLTSLSHIAAPRAWAEFFIRLAEQGRAGSLANGFVHIPIGIVVVAFHPVWSGPGIGLTLIGWALPLKSAIYFTFTDWGAAQLRRRVSLERAWEFRVAGIAAIPLGLYCLWLSMGAPWI